MVFAGAPPADARVVVIALHGRGGSSADVTGYLGGLEIDGLAVVAPNAGNRSWWPNSFLAPLKDNEPFLSSALTRVEETRTHLADAGVKPERIVLMGFSQGACLALEHVARTGTRYRAVLGLSGALIGTAERGMFPVSELHANPPKRLDYATDLSGVPVLLACHHDDPHIPLVRVRESADTFYRLGAEVSLVIHPGQGHAITDEGTRRIREALS